MEKLKILNLADGSSAGQKHILHSDVAFEVERHDVPLSTIMLKINSQAVLIHDEHDRIVLEPGYYSVYHQVEWNPFDQTVNYIYD